MSSRDVLLALAFVSHATRAQAQYAASKQGGSESGSGSGSWNGDWNQSTVNSSAPCCREEWPLNACATQTSTKRPQVYSNDTLLIENDGTVKFTYLGFENVEQVDGFKRFLCWRKGLTREMLEYKVWARAMKKAAISNAETE